MPSLIVHSMPPPCTTCTRSPGSRRGVVRHLAAVHQHDVGAVGIEQLQIVERVAVDDEQIGDEPLAHLADPIVEAEHARAVPGGVLDDLERIEAGLLVQLELARDAEPVHGIDVAGIVARS